MRNLSWISMVMKRLMSCFGFSHRKTEEERQREAEERQREATKRNVQTAVMMCQEACYITREDLEEVRKRILAHDFTKSR